MIFDKSPQALKHPESQFPTPPALGAKQNPNDTIALNDIAIRMFETHRVHSDRSDIYATETNPVEADHADRTPEISTHPPANSAGVDDDSDRDGAENPHGTYTEMASGEELECAGGFGNAFWAARPKCPAKSRNQPGKLTAAMRGPVPNFRETPIGGNGRKGKTGSQRIRRNALAALRSRRTWGELLYGGQGVTVVLEQMGFWYKE